MSLQRISLRDFVIVRQLELDIGNGFSVLSGETGAGKSILIDALQLVLGARADAGVVREGAARTEISAGFAAGAVVNQWLTANGFDESADLLGLAPGLPVLALCKATDVLVATQIQ